MSRTPLTYYGGKQKLAAQIAASELADELETANRRTADRLEALLADCQPTPELLGEDQNNKEEASRSRPSPHRGRRRSRQKGLSMTDRPDIHHDLHGCAGEPFPETTADGAEPTEATYLERVTLPEREQAVARLVEESGFSAEAHRGLRPIYMRWTEGEAMAWIECAADHPEAVPFWKDDPYA